MPKGCCGDEVVNRTAPLADMNGLPDETFCCMARMTYNLVGAAEHFYTGRALARWEWLTEEQRMELARNARKAVKAQPPAPDDAQGQLFYNLLRLITTTA